MTRRRTPSRRLFYFALAFGAFLVADAFLFGWLLLRTLSEREVDRALLETREDVEGLARQLASEAKARGKDLYLAVATEKETKTYIDSVLRQRDLVRRIEIRDKEDRLVYLIETTVQEPADSGQRLLLPSEVPPHYQTIPSERTLTYENVDLEIPIEDFGQIKLGISREQLAARANELRRELLARASVVGGVSLALLLAAWGALLALARRGERLEIRAAEREQMAYLGTLAAGLAHEIRNPLNSLNLNMQLIEEELDGGGRRDSRRLLGITRDEIGRLERLVTDFLAYARPRAPEVEEISTHGLLSRVAVLVQGEAAAVGAQVEVAAGEDLLVLGDRAQLTQLFLNLVQNAIAAVAATGRGGTIVLRASREGPRIRLAVEDSGAGMRPEDIARAFEVFWSTKKGGTGLGLAIADRIARAHGGEVSLDSQPGAGTSAVVSLPAIEPHSAPVSAS